jgi:hypothetical protein
MFSAASPGWRCSRGRCSSAPSCMGWRGSGSSGSTCRVAEGARRLGQRRGVGLAEGGSAVGRGVIASQRLRAWDAMIRPRLFRSPVLAAGLTVSLLLTASLFGTLFFMAQYFQVSRGLSPLAAGASMLPWAATLFLVAPVAGAMVTRIGERALVVAGLALQAAGMVWLAALVRTDAAYALWVVPLMIAGGASRLRCPPCRAPCWPRWSRPTSARPRGSSTRCGSWAASPALRWCRGVQLCGQPARSSSTPASRRC